MIEEIMDGNPGAGPTTTPDAEWGYESIDLDSYLQRIGYDGARTATHNVLRKLHRAHMASICFTNLDLFLGRGIDIDLQSLQRKLVDAQRGGYCFEQNLLFAAALESLGFTVTRFLARIRRGSSAVRPRAHAVLLVEAEGQRFLADVGFGDEGLIEPIPLEDRAQLTVGAWTWRLDIDEDEWVLRSKRSEGWHDVFALRLERHFPVDFETSNHYTASHPRSAFVGKLIAQRGDEERRYTLKNLEFATHYPDDHHECRLLAPEEVVPVLNEVFGLTVTPQEQPLLHTALAKATGTARSQSPVTL